jgi:hypothetical protein
MGPGEVFMFSVILNYTHPHGEVMYVSDPSGTGVTLAALSTQLGVAFQTLVRAVGVVIVPPGT